MSFKSCQMKFRLNYVLSIKDKLVKVSGYRLLFSVSLFLKSGRNFVVMGYIEIEAGIHFKLCVHLYEVPGACEVLLF